MPGLIGSQGVRPGALNMGRIFRALRYRTEQAKYAVYHRPAIFKTDIYVTDYSQKIYGQDFFEAVKDAVKQFVKTKNHSELRISNYCFIRMKGDDQIGFHSSFESNFVGIYLLESGDKKEHICFYDNSKTKEVKVKLKEGDLLLLPSYLLRKFPNLKSKKTYTFVLFDFHIDTPRI